MIEENGHRWGGYSPLRCHYCGMKYPYYLDIKRASKEQPERQDLKDWMKCDKNPEVKKDEKE